MKIPHGFRITLCELWFGYGYTRDGLRCVRVQVRYGKIPPAVYPCSTLHVRRATETLPGHCMFEIIISLFTCKCQGLL